jgi:formylglycine-generating enzyme required for sulfatase activity
MLRTVFLIFSFILLGDKTRAQDSTEFLTYNPKRDYTSKVKIKEAEPQRKQSVKKPSSRLNRHDVLFLTDALCSLYVNGEYRGMVDVAKGKELLLTPNKKYRIRAQNAAGYQVDTVFQLVDDNFFIISFLLQELTAGSSQGIGVESAGAVSRAATKPGPQFSEVTISATADCFLVINDTLKLEIAGGTAARLRLTEESYWVKAGSKVTSEVYETTFTLTAGQPKHLEVPLDVAVLNSPAYRVAQEIQRNLVLLKGGAFTMGSDVARLLGVKDEGPEHTVKIGALLFGRYEVSQAQWEAVMGTNPSARQGCMDCPVENVSWDEIHEFVAKLNMISGRKYRLPTEGEWEFVARSNLKEDMSHARDKKDFLRMYAWAAENADKKPHPVGKKRPNSAGIYDLFGNVAEWCADWYDASYYKSSGMENPAGPANGKEKVVRGGSYQINALDFRPSLRDKRKPGTKSKEIGFRLVQEISEPRA